MPQNYLPGHPSTSQNFDSSVKSSSVSDNGTGSSSSPSPQDRLIDEAISRASSTLKRLGADQFELYILRKNSTKVDSKNQQVDSLSRSQDLGLSVRLIRDQKLGFSFTTSLENSAIDRAIQSANEIAALMPRDPDATVASLNRSSYPQVASFDAEGLAVSIEEKIEMAKKVEAACRRADSRVSAVRSASFSENVYEFHLVDSEGRRISHQSTIFTTSVTCKADQDGESQMGGEFDFSNFYNRLKPDEVGALAARWATELLGAQVPKSMKCPGIIRNNVVSELLDFMSSSFSAEEIDKGRSILAGKEGSEIFSKQVTIIDDGLMAGGYASGPFDGEGSPSQVTRLVHAGTFSTALYDLYYAKKFGKNPTGSAVRSIKAPPSIGISNLYIEPGNKSFESLCRSISRGVLITDLMGVHTANPVTGDFSLGASGILIENGKLTTPVKGFAVAGNVLQIFRDLQEIGNDLRFFGNIGAPSIQIQEISVSGS